MSTKFHDNMKNSPYGREFLKNRYINSSNQRLTSIKYTFDHVYMFCFFYFFRYTIYELYTQDFFLTDLKLSVCWESYKDCVITATIFKNTLLPKRQCIGEFGFQNSCK